jgi:CDP-diacylglycerol pyrophosphatase
MEASSVTRILLRGNEVRCYRVETFQIHDKGEKSVDSGKFDELTRALATSTSRRGMVKVLFMSVLGGALGMGGRSTTLADQVLLSPGGVICPNPPCGSRTDTDPLWQKAYDCLYKGKNCPPAGHDTSGKKQWIIGTDSIGKNYLFIAGERITGIECHKIWDPGAPDYWTLAWEQAQRLLMGHKGKIGMAINSANTRMQCQLHIHMSCIRSDVQKALVTAEGKGQIPMYPKTWDLSKPLSLMTSMSGPRNFLAFSSPKPSTLLVHGQNLFQLLHHMITSQQKRPDRDMQYQTLVVTQRPGGGFYILTSEEGTKTNPSPRLAGGIGAGEQLLNESCPP